MKMDKAIQNKVNFYLYIFTILLSLSQPLCHTVFQLFQAISIPFTLFIYPGMFYYSCFFDQMEKELINPYQFSAIARLRKMGTGSIIHEEMDEDTD